MKYLLYLSLFAILLPAGDLSGQAIPTGAEGALDSSSAVKALFRDPPRRYSSGPLWVWNDMLTEEQIRSTMRDLQGQKVRQVWVHPRPGLMTPYLSPDWFRLWKIALHEAERLDMNVWIYDENSYPSGFAGGLVPEAMPGSRGRGLVLKEIESKVDLDQEPYAIFRITEEGYEAVTAISRSSEDLPEGRYLAALWQEARQSPWFGGKWYVDLLLPGVTEKFLEITMDAYKREIGGAFGRRVPGLFTDEPHLAPAGGIHWNDFLEEKFRKRWGYDLAEHLPALVRPLGDWKRIRHNYQQLLLEQFVELWAKPCHDWCERHGLEFTGHYWEHGWPGASHGPDNMAMYAWQQRPGIDTLMNRYSEDVHAQFGNVRAVRELASAASQLGRERTLCEAYGAGGWDLRFEDMKRIGDWLYVLGVNTLNEHLSYVTIRGARKRDHPQSFSYHAPWWKLYHLPAAYFSRLSAALSKGEQIHDIVVIEPTTTGWMYQPDGSHRGRLGQIGSTFQQLLLSLEAAQVEYDLGCEDIFERHGSVDGDALTIGKRRYTTVVLPPLAENLNGRTMELLELFVANGGTVFCCGEPPSLVEGRPSTRGVEASRKESWQSLEPERLPATLLERSKDGFRVQRDDNDRGILFHHRRRLEDGELLFLVNTSIDHLSSGTIESRALGVERWDPESGGTAAYPFSRREGGISARFELPPCGSLLLFLSRSERDGGEEQPQPVRKIAPAGPTAVERIGPNVLTLDYVDVTAGGETRKKVYVYEASRFVFRKNGMERNPWDSAVQLRDELIRKSFPEGGGFSATYRFVFEESVPGPIEIVIERPDLYRINCNGLSVAASEGAWWLDRSFGRIDITGAIKEGENAVTIEASPFTIYHELESAYLLGNFRLKAVEAGFVIVAGEAPGFEDVLTHGAAPDGTMWLTTGIGFSTDAAGSPLDDHDPRIVFDLGRAAALRRIEIWNYNEVDLTSRGVKRLRIAGSETGRPDTFTVPLGTFELDEAPGTAIGNRNRPGFPARLAIDAAPVRYVAFEILSNQRGAAFPATDAGDDNAFVGLSEVRFFGKGEGAGDSFEIPSVSIHSVSSELTAGFNRRAGFLVDRSGLTRAGWNAQGHPFYAGGVAYTQAFDIPELAGRLFVTLSSWHGSVAQVSVNGKHAGAIWHQPWEIDVTERLVPGRNVIAVTVIGTLKNTLGPHHGAPSLGTAWPAMFHHGPAKGPPPGSRYHTVGYGLFEPFEFVVKGE